MEIGAQLFTVRDYTKTLDEFAKTLDLIAKIGYRVVQVSGTCRYEPQWLKEQMDMLGLKCAITITMSTGLWTTQTGCWRNTGSSTANT